MSLSLQVVLGSLLVGVWALCADSAAGEPTDGNTAGEGENKRPRARDVGIVVGVLPPGPFNAITDVEGVRVGHRTLIEGATIRTGVTAVLPHAGNVFQQKVPAAIAVGNGFGKLVGVTQVRELGLLETPIILTNTLSTFTAADALVAYTLDLPENQAVRSVNPVVGECNDGYLNDIRSQRIQREDIFSAVKAAKGGPVEEGAIGAGTGTRCMGWKGGIGTSSRRLPKPLGRHTLGVLVQTNFGGILTVSGAPVGKKLGRYFLKDAVESKAASDDGSCMIVVATDAPLDARQLQRVAKRALLGLAAVGSPMTHGSGDYAIAFSTDRQLRSSYQSSELVETRKVLRDEALSALFQAAREATEEAVLNSLFKARTMTGHRGMCEAIPIDRVVEICRRHRAISE